MRFTLCAFESFELENYYLHKVVAMNILEMSGRQKPVGMPQVPNVQETYMCEFERCYVELICYFETSSFYIL